MSEKEFDCVIDTHSKEERKTLIDYITNKDGFIISDIDDYEGFQLVGITRGSVGFLGVIASKDLVDNLDYKHYVSVEDYIQTCETGKTRRDRIYEKHGLKRVYVKKTGSKVIMSNRPTGIVYATYKLSDGTLVTIPRDNAKETLAKMEESIKQRNNKKK